MLDKEIHSISFRCPKDKWERVSKAAEKRGLKTASLARQIVYMWLEDNEGEAGE